MVLNLKKYSAYLIILLTLTAAIHFLLHRAAPNFIKLSYTHLYQIYGFLAVLNLVHFIGLRWLFKKWAKFAGLLFTAMSLVKMALCVLFLFPFIFPSTDLSIALVLNFMTVYFITLAFEVVFIAKNMSKP